MMPVSRYLLIFVPLSPFACKQKAAEEIRARTTHVKPNIKQL